MTPQEAADFVAQDNITLSEINPLATNPTNISILANNDKKVESYFATLKAFCVLIYSMLDVDALVAGVLSRITSQKTVIQIPFSISIGQQIQQQSQGVTYQINRIDTYTIEITNLSNVNWDVSKLIIAVKDQLEFYCYPSIKADSTDKKLVVRFANAINTNYNVIIL